MARLVPHPEATAEGLARLVRLQRSTSRNSLTTPGGGRVSAARRLLEELGVRCYEDADLRDLQGFLVSSRRGTEIVVSRRLTEAQRLEVYAHLVAHALLGADHPDLAPATQLEYAPGRAPGDRPRHEVREELVADAVARAILDGRLEAAPRLVHCREIGPARGRLSAAVLRGLHTASLALYWRSRRYQRIRSWPVVAAFTERVHGLFGAAA